MQFSLHKLLTFSRVQASLTLHSLNRNFGRSQMSFPDIVDNLTGIVDNLFLIQLTTKLKSLTTFLIRLSIFSGLVDSFLRKQSLYGFCLLLETCGGNLEDAWVKVRGLKIQLSFRVLDFPQMHGKKNEGSNLSSRKNVLDLSYWNR